MFTFLEKTYKRSYVKCNSAPKQIGAEGVCLNLIMFHINNEIDVSKCPKENVGELVYTSTNLYEYNAKEWSKSYVEYIHHYRLANFPKEELRVQEFIYDSGEYAVYSFIERGITKQSLGFIPMGYSSMIGRLPLKIDAVELYELVNEPVIYFS